LLSWAFASLLRFGGAMRKYSDVFQTLHDEVGPVGNLGRGTHCSVLRAISFQDADGG
jgi:hypothetical protein